MATAAQAKKEKLQTKGQISLLVKKIKKANPDKKMHRLTIIKNALQQYAK